MATMTVDRLTASSDSPQKKKIKMGLVYASDFQTLPVGGTLTFLKNFLKYVDLELFDIDLIGLSLNKTSNDMWQNVSIGKRTYHFLSCLNLKLSSGEKPKVPIRMKSFWGGFRKSGEVFQQNYDILYVHNADFLFPLIRRFGNPIVLHAHGILENASKYARYKIVRTQIIQALYKRGMLYLLKRCSHIISVSELAKNFYCQNYPFLWEKISVIPTMVDLSEFKPDLVLRKSIRLTLGIEEDTSVMVYLGRLAGVKNLFFLIDTFHELIKSLPNVVLLLMGDGEDRQKLMNYTNSLNLGNQIRFLSTIERTELPKYLTAADLLVMPSLAEGLSVALLESLASGLPAVCADVGDTKKVITNAYNGFLIKDYVPDLYIDKIKTVLKNKETMSQNARLSSQEFDAKNVTKKIEKILINVCSKFQASQ